MAEAGKIVHVKLTPTLEQTISDEITDGMSKIYETRQAVDFDRQVQKNKDYYDGIIDPNKWGPWEGSAKYFIQLVKTHVDIIAIKALRQSVGIHPMIQLSVPESVQATQEDLRDREDALDDLLRHQLKIDKLLKAGVYREACTQGASFVKICHSHRTESRKVVKTYTPDKIDEYKYDSWDKLGHSSEEYDRNIGELSNKRDVSFEVDEDYDSHYGPVAYRVPIEKFFARLDIKELERQRLIAEELNYTWKDIQERLDSGYFRKEAIEKIKNSSEDYFLKDYKLYECMLYAKLFNKFQRFSIVYDPDSKAVLRAIYYPYSKICYVPYYIKERDDFLIGEGVVDMLKDSSDYINDLMNGMIDRTSLDNNPVLRVPTTAKLGAYKWGPNAWLPSDEPIEVISAQNRSIDDVQILGMMKTFAETIDGVSADILSGQTTPSDPSGPAAKHAMQTQESNFRIEDYIISLQFGNELLAERAELIALAHGNYNPPASDVTVSYTAHGTTLSINKAAQLAAIREYAEILMALAPEVMQQPQIRRRLLLLYANNLGGSIEREKKDLLPMEIGSLPVQSGMAPANSIEQAFDNMSPEEQEELAADVASMRGQA